MLKRTVLMLTAGLLGVLVAAPALPTGQESASRPAATQPADDKSASPEGSSEAEQSGTEEQVYVHYVEIDLLATDRKGNPVTDLTLDELVVEENGRKQRVASLIRHEAQRAEAVPVPDAVIRLNAADGGAARKSEGIEPRWLVFLFDLDNSEPQQFHELQTAAKQFVMDKARPEDRIAVAVLDGELSLVQNFTSDRGQTLGAIDRAFMSPGQNQRWDTRMRELLMLVDDCQESMASAQSFLAGRDCAASHARNYVQEMRRYTLDYIASIDQLSRLLGGVQGRKYVFLLSHGVSLDPATEAVEAVRAIAGTNQQIASLRFELSEGIDFRRQLYDALDQAIDGKVTLIALDPTVPPSADRGASQRTEFRYGAEPYRVAFTASRDGLDEIAGSTGGRFYGSRKLLADMEKALDAIRGGYTLGYYSDRRYIDRPSDLIKTTVKSKRKRLRISTRRGYFIEPDRPERKLAELDLGEKRQLEQREIVPFEVTIDPAKLQPLVGEREVAVNYSVHLVLRTKQGAPVAESFHFLGHVYPRPAWDQNTIEPPRQVGELELAPGDFVFTMIVRDPALGVTYESSREINVPGKPPASSQG